MRLKRTSCWLWVFVYEWLVLRECILLLIMFICHLSKWETSKSILLRGIDCWERHWRTIFILIVIWNILLRIKEATRRSLFFLLTKTILFFFRLVLNKRLTCGIIIGRILFKYLLNRNRRFNVARIELLWLWTKEIIFETSLLWIYFRHVCLFKSGENVAFFLWFNTLRAWLHRTNKRIKFYWLILVS